MVLSELMGNAVRHARPIAGGVLLVGWRIADGVLTVRVTDGGSVKRIEPRESSPMADSGRGLHIVERPGERLGRHRPRGQPAHGLGRRCRCTSARVAPAPRPT